MFSNVFLEIKPHPALGKGVFARTILQPGTIIFEEQPLCRAGLSPQSKIDAYNALKITDKARLLSLLGRCCCPDPVRCNETPSLKVWHVNGFCRDEGSYLYYLASNYNHDCLPNAVWDINDEATLIVKVIQEIKEGEEITLPYFDGVGTAEERRRTTKDIWRFTCECQSCKANIEITREMYNEWFIVDFQNDQSSVGN
jgi:hypothetical protein